MFVVSILATTLSPRMGMPLLLVFLIIGMLVGEDGFGIEFENVQLAYFMGSLALAVILFDGGLRTEISLFRVGLRPALSLATVGVVITVVVCGVLASWLLDISLLEGLLLGAIVGSTDAAAVFSVLTNQGLALKARVGAALEIESGLNDPMAVFLTVLLVELVAKTVDGFSFWMLGDFVWEMGVGAFVGIAGGKLLVMGIQRLSLSPGLYPLLALFGGILVFGLAAVVHSSGFLAVYLAGLVVGNKVSRGLYNIQRFHDGFAWLAQIGLFLMLGLLVSPHELLDYGVTALLLGVVLIFIARPVAVWLSLVPFQFSWQEKTFISWVGLRGAVPIVLAMFPWIAGIENWEFFFNLAFVMVFLSLVLQGWTVGPAARMLRLNVPSKSSRVQRVELGVPGEIGYEFIGYQLASDSPVLNKPLKRMRLPGKSQLLCLLRNGQLQSLQDNEKFQLDDHVFFLSNPHEMEALEKLLVGVNEAERLSAREFFGDFVIRSHAKLVNLSELYQFTVPQDMQNWSIARYILSKYRQPVVGDRVSLGHVEFVVLSIKNDKLDKIGLKILE